MTPAEIVTFIDGHGFTDTSSTDKYAAINDAAWDIYSREPWPFLEKSVTLAFDGSSATPTNVPSDFKSVLSIIDTQFPRRLYPIRIEDFRSQLGNVSSQSGDPLYYYRLAETLFVWPIPPSSHTTSVMAYLARPAVLTDASAEAAILLPREHHMAIVDGALARLYFQDDDPEMAADRRNAFEQRLVTMRTDIWKTQWDRADTIEITDIDDLYS